MNEDLANRFITTDDNPLSTMAVDVVHYDDDENVTKKETVPLSYYLKDFGQTSEAFLSAHLKLSARSR
jgi:hypothetical protein